MRFEVHRRGMPVLYFSLDGTAALDADNIFELDTLSGYM
jgi:hypothetical protein